MRLRRIPWLVVGTVCGIVGGWWYYIAFFMNNDEDPRWHRDELIVIGATLGLVLGLAADILARRRR